MKNRYLIMLNIFNCQIFKIKDDKLIYIDLDKFNIPYNLKFDDNISEEEMNYDFIMKIDHPTFIHYIFESLRGTIDHGNFVIFYRILRYVSSLLDIIYCNDKSKFEVCFYSSFYLNTDFIRLNSILKENNLSPLLNISDFNYEINFFTNLITQKDYKIYTLNEFGIFPPYSSININSKLEKAREYITKRILESYIFLSNYSHDVLEEITNSFLYDIFLDIPHHICKYQDFKIMLTNDDYTNIEQLIIQEYKDDLSKLDDEAIIIPLLQNRRSQQLYDIALNKLNKKINIFNLIDILPGLYEYHKLNHSISKIVSQKLFLTETIKLFFVDEDFFKNCTHLTNKEKTEFRNHFRKIIDKYKNIKIITN